MSIRVGHLSHKNRKRIQLEFALFPLCRSRVALTSHSRNALKTDLAGPHISAKVQMQFKRRNRKRPSNAQFREGNNASSVNCFGILTFPISLPPYYLILTEIRTREKVFNLPAHKLIATNLRV
jgi:hypothetical protein